MASNYPTIVITANTVINIDYCADRIELGKIDTSGGDACVDIPTVISELNSSFTALFPNPASDILNINLDSESEAKLSISEMSGRVVMQADLVSSQSTISAQSLPNGIYLVEVVSGTKHYKEKLIITH